MDNEDECLSNPQSLSAADPQTYSAQCAKCVLCRITDPRFKHLFFSADSYNSVKQYILHFLSDVTVPHEKDNISSCSEFDSDCDDVPLSHLLPTPEKKSKMTSQKSVWDSFSDMVSLMDIIDRNASPREWWKSNKKAFPNLALMASKFLSASASTIFSEQLFSEAGNVFESKRNRLSPENRGKLVSYSTSYAQYFNLPFLQPPKPEPSCPCFECPEKFTNSEEFQKHLNVHDVKDENIKPKLETILKNRKRCLKKYYSEALECNICGERFYQYSYNTLRNHLNDKHKFCKGFVEDHYTVFL
nr:unnamed protein product [Callosobruchus analis]